MMFYRFLVVCQHFCICIIVCLLSCQCRQNEFIAQSLTPNRDVGDKYLTFQSLDARNLLRTNVRYNSLVHTHTHTHTCTTCAQGGYNGLARILTISHLRHIPNRTSRSPGRKAKCEVPAIGS